jgi:predicted sulfurtransferase
MRRISQLVAVIFASLMLLGKGYLFQSHRAVSATAVRRGQRLLASVPPPSLPQQEDILIYYSQLSEKLARKGEYTALSFFKFALRNSQRPVTCAEALGKLKSELVELDVKGTLLVAANEGYNGAFCLPSKSLGAFYSALYSADAELFRDLDLNIGESFNCTDPAKLPFKKLVVKQKAAVLTDGLSEQVAVELDFTNAGAELTPEQWHAELQSENPPLVLDCRNSYESDMGTFENATPLNTTTFSDSFEKLDALLANAAKNTRILTFCTGGIRCIKTNAYLQQRLGMTNIGRLKKGIIHYEQWVEEEKMGDDTLFKGKNFLFDRRRMATTEDPESISS